MVKKEERKKNRSLGSRCIVLDWDVVIKLMTSKILVSQFIVVMCILLIVSETKIKTYDFIIFF